MQHINIVKAKSLKNEDLSYVQISLLIFFGIFCFTLSQQVLVQAPTQGPLDELVYWRSLLGPSAGRSLFSSASLNSGSESLEVGALPVGSPSKEAAYPVWAATAIVVDHRRKKQNSTDRCRTRSAVPA